jgi:hypothetical protein
MLCNCCETSLQLLLLLQDNILHASTPAALLLLGHYSRRDCCCRSGGGSRNRGAVPAAGWLDIRPYTPRAALAWAGRLRACTLQARRHNVIARCTLGPCLWCLLALLVRCFSVQGGAARWCRGGSRGGGGRGSPMLCLGCTFTWCRLGSWGGRAHTLHGRVACWGSCCSRSHAGHILASIRVLRVLCGRGRLW